MSEMLTIHVLSFGELYQHLLNAVATLMKQDNFLSLLKLTALIGIIMASIGYIKERNPFCYAKWLLGYLLVCNLVILPKTSIMIRDISAQDNKVVANVPVVFALLTSVMTTVGVLLAESYDALLSMPDDLTYTKTGSLFGAKLIQASHEFKLLNPQLKNEINAYFRNCVVGDIALNHKYSVSDLTTNLHIWNLISSKPSPLRMTPIDNKVITCANAAKLLKPKLEQEVKTAYNFYGINIFGKARQTTYEKLFEKHLTSSFLYYQNLTDTASNIFLQAMMINAIQDGIKDYQALTNDTASVINQQVSRSQAQHRYSWAIAGQKATWFLPMLHSLLMILLFGLFPIVLLMTTLPNGHFVFRGYLQFLISLQFWPLLFAILNAAMTMYGAELSQKYGGINMLNLEKLDELHADLSGVSGYLMLFIPFLAKGLVSSLSDAFNNLATSMSSHLQGSAMAVASEAAGASFSLGQTSFYNTSANQFSANKHDSNWAHLHGMHTEQAKSGVLKTLTENNAVIFDASQAISKNAVSIHSAESLTVSLNQAYESSQQALKSEAAQFQNSLSSFAHSTIQLSNLKGHDLRLGTGLSENESSQLSSALSTLTHTAEEYANRTGVSKENALAHLFGLGAGASLNGRSDSALAGKVWKFATGASANVNAHTSFERTSSDNSRFSEGADHVLSAREAHDFNNALSKVKQFTQNHHFEDNQSTTSQLAKQMGADLREAETLNQHFDAQFSKAERILEAKSYVESHAAQVNADLNQAFPTYVAQKVGESKRDELFNNPGDINALNQLQSLGDSFITEQKDILLSSIGKTNHELKANYQQEKDGLVAKEEMLVKHYQQNNRALSSSTLDLGVPNKKADALKAEVNKELHNPLSSSAISLKKEEIVQSATSDLANKKVQPKKGENHGA